MRKFVVFWVVLLFSTSQFLVSAQEEKIRIVILDPAMSGSVEEGIDMIVREDVSATIVNLGNYHIIERSLIDKIIQEQKFARSGMVDDSQIVELGKMAGADKVCLTTVAVTSVRTNLSVKIVDVKTAQVERQASRTVQKITDMLDNIPAITLDALGETASKNNRQTAQSSGGKGRSIFNPWGALADAVTPDPKDDKEKELKQAQKDLEHAQQQLQQIQSAPVQSQLAVADGDVVLFFAGSKARNNPGCRILVNGIQVGTGTLNQGFSIAFNDTRPGKHEVKIEWEGTVTSKSYDINTSFKKHFEFHYTRGGFGMEFLLKD